LAKLQGNEHKFGSDLLSGYEKGYDTKLQNSTRLYVLDARRNVILVSAMANAWGCHADRHCSGFVNLYKDDVFASDDKSLEGVFTT
jgi:hypothetical protein